MSSSITRTITVTMDDGTSYPAKVVGRDARTDLALLKVDAGKSLPYVAFGDSAKERVGDWVIAVGNPFGLGGTVTAGIVSAHDRDLNSGPYDGYLQIDAPINPGNSGRPIVQPPTWSGDRDRTPGDLPSERRQRRHRLRHPVQPRHQGRGATS